MIRSLVPALILVCALVAPADAVVPTGKKVLKAATDHWPAPAAARVNYMELRPDGPPRAALAIVTDGQGRVRFDVQDLAEGKTTSRVFVQGAEAGPGGEAPLVQAPTWVLWLVGAPADAVVAAKGIDTDTTSLAHRGGDILWVLGAGARDGAAPQLHFERRTGRLYTTIEVRGSGDTAADGTARVELHHEPPPDHQGKGKGKGTGEGEAVSTWPTRLRIDDGGSVQVFVRTLHEVGVEIQPSEVGALPAVEGGATPEP